MSTSPFPNLFQGRTYNSKLSDENEKKKERRILETPPLLPTIKEMVDAGAWTIKVITGEQVATSAFFALSTSFWDSDLK